VEIKSHFNNFSEGPTTEQLTILKETVFRFLPLVSGGKILALRRLKQKDGEFEA
jgi:hypothetical protein